MQPINGLQTQEFDVTCQTLRNVNELLWASHYYFVVQFKSAIDFIPHASLKIRWSNQGEAFYLTLKKNRYVWFEFKLLKNDPLEPCAVLRVT